MLNLGQRRSNDPGGRNGLGWSLFPLVRCTVTARLFSAEPSRSRFRRAAASLSPSIAKHYDQIDTMSESPVAAGDKELTEVSQRTALRYDMRQFVVRLLLHESTS